MLVAAGIGRGSCERIFRVSLLINNRNSIASLPYQQKKRDGCVLLFSLLRREVSCVGILVPTSEAEGYTR